MPADQVRAGTPARRPWWPRSIRWQVTLAASLVAAAVLVGAAAALLLVHRAALVAQLDEQLQADADRLGGELRRAPTTPFEVRAGVDDDAIAMVVALDGTVLASSSTRGVGPIGVIPSGTADELRTVQDDDIDSGRSRVLSRRITTAGGDDVVLQLASPHDDIDELVRALGVASAIGLPVVVVALGVLIWVVVGRTLRPVERIRADVAAIGPAQLDRRVAAPTGTDEIARLAATMNLMLERLDASAQRQRRFTADASHELRTPLTRMRAELEAACADGSTSPVDESVRAEVLGMQRLVEDLLVLAGGDEQAATAPMQLVDLDDVVLEELRTQPRRAVSVDASAVSAAQVTGAPDQLRRVVRNLLDNAYRHATSNVRIALGESGDIVTLCVEDDGPGVPPARRAEIFERFSRTDEGRHAASGGTGLGLAIVREVLTRHHGSVELDPEHRPGGRFVVTLPAAAPGRSLSSDP